MTGAGLVGVISLAAGVALSLFAGWSIIRRRRFLRGSGIATGVIVGVRSEPDGADVQPMSYPKIRFRTASGRDITFESSMASGGGRWRSGDAVSVRYAVDHPQTAEINDAAALWGAPALFALLAAVFLGVGVGLLSGLITP